MRFEQIWLRFQFRNPDTTLYNPVIPRVIFGIPPPTHAFNSEFTFKSRTRASKNREIPDPEKPIGQAN